VGENLLFLIILFKIKDYYSTFKQFGFKGSLQFEQEWNSYNYGERRLVGTVVSSNLRFLIRSGLSPLEYSGHVDEPSDSKSEAIIKKLKGIEQLESYLVDIAGTRKTNIALVNGILEKIEEVNVLIDKELIKSENYK